MIFVKIGIALIYISPVIIILEHIRNQRKIKWFDWIITFIPIIRVLYMIIEIEAEE